MEAPTTTRRPTAPTTRAGTFPSARMLEAQRTFQSVVKQELQLLLTSGTKREEAVKLLLRRIVASTEPPEAAAVRGVMRQFQMNYDDAVRALIVKQELGRLKRQGLDSFAAIEELTRKMRSREEVEQTEEVERDVEGQEEVEHTDILVEEKEEVSTQENEKEEKENETMPAAEMASPTSEKDGNETSLSLIQRIGKVSISSGNTPEQQNEEQEEHEEQEEKEEQEASEDTDGEENESVGERNKTVFNSPLRVQSPSNSNLADLTPQSRKRRAAFGVQYDADSNSHNNSSGLTVKPLFPSLKKQKLCAEVGDGFLQVVTRKSKPTSSGLSKSAAATGKSGSSPNRGKGGGSTRGEHSSKNLHKRQRVSPAGMQDDDESPIAEELRVSHVHHRHHAHHHSKRQKSGSTH